MLLQATLALSLVVSSLRSVCCDFSISSAVMPLACPVFNLVWNSGKCTGQEYLNDESAVYIGVIDW